MGEKTQLEPQSDRHFTDLLKRARVAARLTQEELAERAGVSARCVRDIERGRVRHPRPQTARQLGGALGYAGAALADFVGRARAEYWNARVPGGYLPVDVPRDAGRRGPDCARLAEYLCPELDVPQRRWPASGRLPATEPIQFSDLAVDPRAGNGLTLPAGIAPLSESAVPTRDSAVGSPPAWAQAFPRLRVAESAPALEAGRSTPAVPAAREGGGLDEHQR